MCIKGTIHQWCAAPVLPLMSHHGNLHIPAAEDHQESLMFGAFGLGTNKLDCTASKLLLNTKLVFESFL